MALSLSKTDDDYIEALTPRELDVLGLLAQNLTDREIAGSLTLALSSVKWYARQIYQKLGVENRRQAVIKAGKLRLLETRRKPLAPAHNLPRQLTRFIGREKEIKQVVELVWKHPLVTLAGSGGVGKTRLALTAALELLDEFPDGIWLVELAALSEPDQVLRAVAIALGVHEEPGHTLFDSLGFFLGDRQVLLILDNCEHLVDHIAGLARDLLQAGPGLKLLTTSRESLGVDGERVFRVPSLQVPPLSRIDSALTMDELLGFEAIQLFIDRAQAVYPEFKVTDENIGYVVQICRRLDGIPLAIELAASRVVSLEVDQIASRLEHDFRMLAGGSRTAVERQRALRATLEWSYNLLSEGEQKLFCCLAVFSGGFTLAAVEAVCAGEAIPENEILDLLTRLTNKSVVLVDRQADREPRYRMLESLRQFAQEKLSESGESEALRRRHCDWVLRFAETAGLKFNSDEALIWLKLLKADHENLRAALEWSIGENEAPEAGLRILVALVIQYWISYGNAVEAYQWLEKGLAVLENLGTLNPLLQVKILLSMAWIKCSGDGFEAVERLENIIKLCKDLGDQALLVQAMALILIGWVEGYGLGSFQQAIFYQNESEAILRDMGLEGRWALAYTLSNQVYMYALLNDQSNEQAYAEEFEAICQELGESLVWAHKQLGDIARRKADYDLAFNEYSQHIAFCEKMGDDGDVSDTTRKLAEVRKDQGRYAEAFAYYRVALKMLDHFGDREGVSYLLACLALNQIACSRNLPVMAGDPPLLWAARLLGASQALIDLIKAPMPVRVELIDEHKQALTFLQENLGPGEFQAAWAEGLAMKTKHAVAYAMEDVPQLAPKER